MPIMSKPSSEHPQTDRRKGQVELEGIGEFQPLLRGLVKVPKTEVDAEIKKERVKRKRRQRRR
jgi:hypothetical protein